MLQLRWRGARPSVIALADRARDAKRWDLAAQCYQRALRRNPDNPPIWVQYGHVLKESGHLAKAEEAYRTAIAYDQKGADAHLQLGHVLKLQGRADEAEAAYLTALTLDPSLNEASSELAMLGWTEAHFSELRGALETDIANPMAAAGVTVTSAGRSVVLEQSAGRTESDLTSDLERMVAKEAFLWGDNVAQSYFEPAAKDMDRQWARVELFFISISY